MRVTYADATLAALNPRTLTQGYLTVDDGLVVAVGTVRPEDPGTIIPCSGMLLMPGNVCAHTHLYSALARGMPAPRRSPSNFLETLEFMWWRLDRALDHEGVRLSTVSGLIDAVKCGTTTLVDHHSSPNAITGSLEIQAQAFENVGVRGVLCYEVTDRNGPAGREEGLSENDHFLRRNRRPLLRGLVGAHASFTLEDDTLDSLANIADSHDSGIHIHVAEDIVDETHCMSAHRQRVVERLDSRRVLREKSLMAHCVHLDEPELRIIRERGSRVAHNCRSNLNNGVGRARVASLGNHVALGTDGLDGNMFAESQTAYWRAREDSLRAQADDFMSMLSAGNQIVETLFGVPCGGLRVGDVADLLVMRYDPPTPLVAENLAWHWMFGLSGASVRDVMVAGEWVVRDGDMVTVDEEKMRAEARLEAKRIWGRMETM